MSLSEREKALEEKFFHDMETEFRIRIRQLKFFGEWLAEQIGAVDAARTELIDVILHEGTGPKGTYGAIQAGMDAIVDAGIDLSEHRLSKHLQECFSRAEQDVKSAA